MALAPDVQLMTDSVAAQIDALNVTDASAVRAAGVAITRLAAFNPVRAGRFIDKLREVVLHVPIQE